MSSSRYSRHNRSSERNHKDYSEKDRRSAKSTRNEYDRDRKNLKRSSRDRDRSSNYDKERSNRNSSPRRRRHYSSDDEKDDRPSWENSTVKRHAETIQQKKLLWSKGKVENNSAEETDLSVPTSSLKSSPSANSKPSLESAWTSMFAATNADSQKMDKFQRLMGMKKGAAPSEEPQKDKAIASNPNLNELESEKRRQQEMTEQLDRQYALARATTHQGRGRGFGFI